MANIFKIVDIGTQSGEYQGKPIKHRQIIISWELDQYLEDGRPLSQREFYTLSLTEKANFRKMLLGWRGHDVSEDELNNGYDLKKILGRSCYVTLTANKNGKIHITSVIKIPAGMKPMGRVNPPVFFDLDAFDQVVFDSLTDWEKEKIMASPEYQGLNAGSSMPEDPKGQKETEVW